MESDVWKKFEENDITHSAAHHLLAVFRLREERGYARVTDVARHLSITTGSASTNLKSLKAKGLVTEDENKFLCLSEMGEGLARAVIARREIFHKFLRDVLHVSDQQAEIDACKTEHLLSHETSEKLLAFMQRALVSREQFEKVSGKRLDATVCPVIEGRAASAAECAVCEDHCLFEDC